MLYPILAMLTAGSHIFSLKLLSLSKAETFYPQMAVVIVTMVMSRYFIMKGMETLKNPTLMHLILNLSVFVTFFASWYYLQIRDFKPEIFVLGILCFVVGTYCINESYKM
jgi:hypothetical protein